jgi:hypothetical protein
LIDGFKIFSKFCIGILCLTAILTTPASFAGDEDMSPNAYHIFDPETGYMITVESVPDGQSATTVVDSSQPAQAPADRQGAAQITQVWIYVIAAMLVAGGLIAWRRNREKIDSDASH